MVANWIAATPFEALIASAPQAAYLTVITTLNAASTLHFTHAAAEDRFTYLRFYAPCTVLLIVGLLTTPNLTLNGALHLMGGVALLQLMGCWWDGRRTQADRALRE